MFKPPPTDQLLVNGVELTVDSSLRAVKAGCTHYGLSTTFKGCCFRRLLNHQKQLGLRVVHSSAEQSRRELIRAPRVVTLQIPPDEATQQEHFLTHVPYQPWCSSCNCFRARADHHKRTGGARRSGLATISFDLTLHTQRACQRSRKPRTLTLLWV